MKHNYYTTYPGWVESKQAVLKFKCTYCKKIWRLTVEKSKKDQTVFTKCPKCDMLVTEI